MIGRLLSWWRMRRGRNRVRELVSTAQGKLGCEACAEREAVHSIPSHEEDRDVLLCDWCYRRWRRMNEARAIPRTRRRKKVGS